MAKHFNPRSAAKLVTVATAAVLGGSLFGCGGGGGGGSSSNDPTPGAPLPTNTCAVTQSKSDGLIISEVSTNYGDNSGPWFEVYNASSQTLDLSKFKVRTRTTNVLGSISAGPNELSLPEVNLPPNGHLVIASLNAAVVVPTVNQDVVYIGSDGRFPHWNGSGFIEIVKDGATVDAVRFGYNTDSTVTNCGWRGTNFAAMPSSATDFGKSIVRLATTIGQNSHSASDWTLVPFSTPGGPNDVPANAEDADNDGIPDSAEVAGGTYAGLDLYAMGARTRQPDIFVQVDYMAPADSGPWVDKEVAWRPHKLAMDKVVAAFARRGYALHLDVGDRYYESVGTGYNLGYGKEIPFAACSYFEPDRPVAGCEYAMKYKTANMPARLRNIFHYAVFGVSHSNNRYTGQAEINGNDLGVMLGNQLGPNLDSINYVINVQAATFMHELGHNLGLRHGGFEDRNYKPNYYSIMNYLYTILGLPNNPKGAGVMQRWNLQQGKQLSATEATIIDGPRSDTFLIDFSDGSGAKLDGASLLEQELIGRGADPGVYADWNGNSVMDTARYGVYQSLATTPTSLDPDGASPMQDYNDWAHINLAFSRRAADKSTILKVPSSPKDPGAVRKPVDPLIGDRQEWVVEGF